MIETSSLLVPHTAQDVETSQDNSVTWDSLLSSPHNFTFQMKINKVNIVGTGEILRVEEITFQTNRK